MQTRTDKLLALLDKHGPGLHALLTRITLQRDAAEDLMQDLFIRLNNSDKLDTVDNLPAYARTVAINLAFDWRRKKKLRNHVNTDDAPELTTEDAAPLERMMQDERLKGIMAATERLNKLHRQVFIMRYVEQQSFEQIAQETGKTPHHVRALCSRAMARVRQLCSKTLTTTLGILLCRI